MSNIFYTTGNYRNKLAELYKLWKGNDIRESNFIMLNDHYSVAVDKDTKEYVGVATLIVIYDQVHNRSWGLVENVFVKPEYRRKGIGVGLMNHIESLAMGLGCEFIKLTSRKPEAQELYKFLGYEQGMSFRKKLQKI